jgi:hypothetical protein
MQTEEGRGQRARAQNTVINGAQGKETNKGQENAQKHIKPAQMSRHRSCTRFTDTPTRTMREK